MPRFGTRIEMPCYTARRRCGAMTQVPEAIYERGTFRPLVGPLPALAEGQRVQIAVDVAAPESVLALAAEVYAGLSEEEVDEIERIATDRSAWTAPRRRPAGA
jgi:predicted DNA-binding antitoxin AbrB/MazE fold protein